MLKISVSASPIRLEQNPDNICRVYHERQVAASTQNQAFSALLFLYKEVLELPLQTNFQFIGAKNPKRLPVVLTKNEVQEILRRLSGIPLLVVQLLYGSGLRIDEAIRLRVQKIDFEQGQILLRDGKGAQDRMIMFPKLVEDSWHPDSQRNLLLGYYMGNSLRCRSAC